MPLPADLARYSSNDVLVEQQVPAAQFHLRVDQSFGLYLWIDGSMVSAESPTSGKVTLSSDRSEDGTVVGVSWIVHDRGDGTLFLESADFANVFLALLPAADSRATNKALTPFAAGAFMAGSCWGPCPAARFKLTQSGTEYFLESHQNPGWFFFADNSRHTIIQDTIAQKPVGARQTLDSKQCFHSKAQLPDSVCVPFVAVTGDFPSGAAVADLTAEHRYIPGYTTGDGPLVSLEHSDWSGIYIALEPVSASGEVGTVRWIEGLTAMGLWRQIDGEEGGHVYESIAAPRRFLKIDAPVGSVRATDFDHATAACDRDGHARMTLVSNIMTATVLYAVQGDTPTLCHRKMRLSDELPDHFSGDYAESDTKRSVDGESAAVGNADPQWVSGAFKAVGMEGCEAKVGRGVAPKLLWVKDAAVSIAKIRKLSRRFSVDQLHQLINAYGPIVRLHPDEPFLPCSVEWYLANAVEVDTHTVPGSPRPEIVRTNRKINSAADLTFGNEPGRYSIELDPAKISTRSDAMLPLDARRGNLATAKAYVRAVDMPQDGYIDLQFWFFYAYNGSGTARVRIFEADTVQDDFRTSTWPLGDHQADWELCVIRIDHATCQPRAVLLSQHSGGEIYQSNDELAQFQRDGSRFIIYSSLNGHGSYCAADDNPTRHFNFNYHIVGVEGALINSTKDGGPSLDCSVNYELISTSWNDPAVPEPLWAKYPGRWGKIYDEQATVTQEMTQKIIDEFDNHAAIVMLLGGPVASLASSFASTVVPLVLQGRLKDAGDLSGPTGPIDKPGKWNGTDYRFEPPKPPIVWRGEGNSAGRAIVKVLNVAAHVVNVIKDSPLRVIKFIFG